MKPFQQEIVKWFFPSFFYFPQKNRSYYFLFSSSSTPFKGMSIKINITKTMAAIFSMKEKRWIPKVIGSFFGLQQKNGRLKVNQLFNKVCSKRYGTKNIGSFIKFIAEWFFPKTKKLKNYFFTKQSNHHHKNKYVLTF